jgi:hypothetical protein
MGTVALVAYMGVCREIVVVDLGFGLIRQGRSQDPERQAGLYYIGIQHPAFFA